MANLLAERLGEVSTLQRGGKMRSDDSANLFFGLWKKRGDQSAPLTEYNSKETPLCFEDSENNGTHGSPLCPGALERQG